jgi:hypothetical protein
MGKHKEGHVDSCLPSHFYCSLKASDKESRQCLMDCTICHSPLFFKEWYVVELECIEWVYATTLVWEIHNESFGCRSHLGERERFFQKYKELKKELSLGKARKVDREDSLGPRLCQKKAL